MDAVAFSSVAFDAICVTLVLEKEIVWWIKRGATGVHIAGSRNVLQ